MHPILHNHAQSRALTALLSNRVRTLVHAHPHQLVVVVVFINPLHQLNLLTNLRMRTQFKHVTLRATHTVSQERMYEI
jgi:hypothetical protein